jgi:hypothetical protein
MYKFYINCTRTYNINYRFFIKKTDLKQVSSVGKASNEYFEMTSLWNEKYEWYP